MRRRHFFAAGEGEPHGGVAGGGADFDVQARGCGGGEEGEELARLARDLAEAFEHGEVLPAMVGVKLLEVGHAVADGGGEVVEHGSPRGRH